MKKKSIIFSNQNVLLILYAVINLLFVLKYAKRIEFIHNYLSTAIYGVFLIGSYYFFLKLKEPINELKKFDTIFFIFSLILFIGLLLVNYTVDGFSLNSDRWSALEVLIKSILEGKYPYSVLDHLGNTSSNLPGLFYVGLPFYILGDVGYLQAFVFLIITLFIYFSKVKNDKKIFLLLLILLAPSYFWEVFAKSDLMSNCFLVLLFISFWQEKYFNQIFRKHILLAFFVAFFALTRGTVVIPLTLFLFYSFYKINIRKKISFVVWMLFFAIVISLPILINLPTLDFVIEHNPFNHQTRYAPKVLIISSLLLPFVFSFKLKEKSDVFLYSTYILAGLMFLTFIINAIEEGFNANLYGDLFDISYLSIIFPSLFFYFLEKFKLQAKSI